MDQKQRDICQRLAFEIPIASVLGIIAAQWVGEMVDGQSVTHLQVGVWFWWFWLVVIIVAGYTLLIIGRTLWVHYITFPVYLFVVQFCTFPFLFY